MSGLVWLWDHEVFMGGEVLIGSAQHVVVMRLIQKWLSALS